VFARVVPFEGTNAPAKLLGPSKLLARLQEDEAVAVLTPLAFPHRVIPIVMQEIFVNRDDRTLPPDGLIYGSRVLLPGYTKISCRVHVVLRPENVPKIAIAFVQENPLPCHRRE